MYFYFSRDMHIFINYILSLKVVYKERKWSQLGWETCNIFENVVFHCLVHLPTEQRYSSLFLVICYNY